MLGFDRETWQDRTGTEISSPAAAALTNAIPLVRFPIKIQLTILTEHV